MVIIGDVTFYWSRDLDSARRAAVLPVCVSSFSPFTVDKLWVSSISVCIVLQQEELFSWKECRASISGSEAIFSLCRGDHWPRAVTIASSLDSGCGLSLECIQDGCNGTCVK